MFKFLFKLGIIVVVVYALIQVPFFAEKADQLKASFFEKMDNVTTEAERVKGKVDDFTEMVGNAKNTIQDTKDKVEDATKKVQDGLQTLERATDVVNDVMNKKDTTEVEADAETETNVEAN